MGTIFLPLDPKKKISKKKLEFNGIRWKTPWKKKKGKRRKKLGENKWNLLVPAFTLRHVLVYIFPCVISEQCVLGMKNEYD